MNAPARAAAYRVVRRVFEDGAYADRAFASAASGLDDRDRALAQRIAYGTVQRMRTIDHGIDELGSRPAAQLDPPVLAALRVAAYETAWSEAPAHAVVNDAVELVREAGVPRATGFTNAVARRLAEGFPALVASLPPGPLAESYPDWIYAIWVRDSGPDDALALMRAQNEPAELVVRSDVPIGTPTDVPGCLQARARRNRRGRRDADLAEPRLPARGARAWLARRGADPRRLRGPGSQGDHAPRPGHGGRAPPRPRARARGERAPARRHERPGREHRRPRARRARLRPGARRRSLLRARRSRQASGPPLAARRRSRGCSSSCSARPPSGRGPAARFSTRSAP